MKMCWFYRLWRVLTDGAPGGLLPSVRRHEATCPHCRDRAAGEADLEARLRTEVSISPSAASPFLARRVLQAARSGCGPEAQGGRGWRWAGVLGGVAALVLAIDSGLLGTRSKHATEASGNEPTGRESRMPGEGGWYRPGIAEALPAADRLIEFGRAVDGPLQAELDAVVVDARRAVQYLASSLLPETGP
jgi:hypothetical protein